MKAVVFDFGYTLVNEDRVWKAAAQELGWPESVFFAALGSVIERRRRHRDVLEILGGEGSQSLAPFEPRDFYADALPTLRAAKESGLVVGIAGNFSSEIASTGMASVWIMRGPWAIVQQGWPEAEAADTRIRELAELPL